VTVNKRRGTHPCNRVMRSDAGSTPITSGAGCRRRMYICRRDPTGQDIERKLRRRPRFHSVDINSLNRTKVTN